MSLDEPRVNSVRSAIGRGFLLFVLILALPILLLLIVLWSLVCAVVLVFVWSTWLRRGKDMLLVYSNSPYWQEYFETGFLPLVAGRSEILNWSEKSAWPKASLKRIVFQVFAGPKEYNPMVLFFAPFRWPKRIRFYQAFRDLRHGNKSTLRNVERQLSEVLALPIQLDAFHLPPSV